MCNLLHILQHSCSRHIILGCKYTTLHMRQTERIYESLLHVNLQPNPTFCPWQPFKFNSRSNPLPAVKQRLRLVSTIARITLAQTPHGFAPASTPGPVPALALVGWGGWCSQASRATHLARLIQHNIRRITVPEWGVGRRWAGFAS